MNSKKPQGAKPTGVLRSVSVLAGGTAFAQLATVLALPLITRLYSPADFSGFSVFLSIVTIVSVAACLRLEIAIPLPKTDRLAANLLVLSCILSSLISLSFAVLLWIWGGKLAEVTNQHDVLSYSLLIPLGIWIMSIYTSFQFWATRKRRFGLIASARMLQAGGAITVQLGLGSAGLGATGLILAQVASNGISLIRLSRDAFRADNATLRKVDLLGMRKAFSAYRKFPQYSTFESLANSAGTQLPIIIIAASAVDFEAGYMALAMRAMAIPMGLIGAAVAQVYLSQAPEQKREGKLTEFTVAILKGLAKTGVGPLTLAGLIAMPVFPILFGKEWGRAGELLLWMTPWFVMQYLTSPVSMTLHVMNCQRKALTVQVLGLASRVGAVWIAAANFPGYISETFAIASFIFYCFYFSVVTQALKLTLNDYKIIFRSALLSGIPCAALGGLILVASK